VPIPAKGLWQLDVDGAIFQDVGLDDNDNGSTEPPLWLTSLYEGFAKEVGNCRGMLREVLREPLKGIKKC
jgi:hypothetical protein